MYTITVVMSMHYRIFLGCPLMSKHPHSFVVCPAWLQLDHPTVYDTYTTKQLSDCTNRKPPNANTVHTQPLQLNRTSPIIPRFDCHSVTHNSTKLFSPSDDSPAYTTITTALRAP